jgi:DNA replication protein DnaC
MRFSNHSQQVTNRRILTEIGQLTREKLNLICACGNKYTCYNLGKFTKSICDDCLKKVVQQEREQEELAYRALEEKDQRERVLRAHIPVDWVDKTFENSDSKIHPAAFEACRNYANQFNKFDKNTKSLIICSDVLGSGKTHLALCIANHVLHHKRIETRYIKAMAILLEIKGTFQRSAKEDEEDVLNSLLTPKLLVIDDLGVTPPTEFTTEIFWAVFDRRMENHLPVIITTNYLPEDNSLGMRIGKGALSRLLGMCQGNIITFKGKDLRRITK